MQRSALAQVIDRFESELLADWLKIQADSLSSRKDLISQSEARSDSQTLLAALRDATGAGNFEDISGPEWARVRDLLNDLSKRRVIAGATPSETARFVFSLKQPLFDRIQKFYENEPAKMIGEIWSASALIDRLGLHTTELHQKSREEVIARQQQEMMELSTPVVELWHGVLALPLIGTLDSNRTQVVMQNLLEAIVAKSASIAIIDITGVPTVDTLVAQHLLKTVAAARLMGADCIISGIRPQIAQTIIHLGVDLGNVITKATLADAFQIAMKRLHLTITKA